MPITIAAVCDRCFSELAPGAPVPAGYGYQTIGFDRPEETWGELVAFLVSLGWRVHLGPDARARVVLCPRHAEDDAKETAPCA